MMTDTEIAQRRLQAQQLAGVPEATPEAVVQSLGAVQAQDYAAALWAVGLRMGQATEGVIARAVADGTILRTHVLRPTWHFVTPADIRPLLALTAPRVNVANATWYRQFALDDATFARSNAALTTALADGKHRTRPQLAVVLAEAGIATANRDRGQRLSFLMMRAELDGVICSGAPVGKQQTYALLDERAPATVTPTRDEALAALARRYFTGHGPATLPDFIWWSGLTTVDARNGLAIAKLHLQHETVGDRTYWFAASAPPMPDASADATDAADTAYLLPNYDEYTVGYTDRSAVFAASHTDKLNARSNILFHHAMVHAGRIVGTWKRAFNKGAVVITLAPFAPLTDAQTHAFAAATARYSAFLGLPIREG